MEAKAMLATNLRDLHDLFSVYRAQAGWVFRGHSDVGWALIPAIGRDEVLLRAERPMFEDWSRRAPVYAPGNRSKLQLLALAQHQGLPTRLLDWTANPLVAAFFAANASDSLGGTIFALKLRTQLDEKDQTDPLAIEGVYRVALAPVGGRMLNQQGSFTLHGPPDSALPQALASGDELHRIFIPADFRGALLAELRYYGFDYSTMFPDLEGLTDFLRGQYLAQQKEPTTDWKAHYEKRIKALRQRAAEIEPLIPAMQAALDTHRDDPAWLRRLDQLTAARGSAGWEAGDLQGRMTELK